MENSVIALEERVEKLESELKHAKRQRRLTWGVAAVVVVLAVVMFYPQGKVAAQGNIADEIRARKIVLVDENGKTRASLGVLKDGPALGLTDENGKPGVVLSVDKDGAGLFLYENGKSRAVLGLNKDGPVLWQYDENGEPRVALGALKDGKGLLLYDENGKPRVLLVTTKGRTGLALYDENGKSYWSTPLQNEGR